MRLTLLKNSTRFESATDQEADTRYLGFQHLLETSVHFFFFDKFATVGLGDTFLDGGANAGVFFEQGKAASSLFTGRGGS